MVYQNDSAQKTIFGPVFAMFGLTIVVWIYMYIRRIHFLISRNIKPEQVRRPEDMARLTPPDVSSPSDNLKNLFEIPVLFYVFSIYLFVTKNVDSIYVFAGWIYFLFRVAHSAIHCTVNIVLIRFYVYLASCLVLFLMIFRAAFGHFFY